MTAREEYRDYLLRFLNIPYRWGGSNPLTGLDCSGFDQFALDYLGLDQPGDQTAHGIYLHMKAITKVPMIGLGHSDLGDQIFYGTPAKVTHVAVALDDKRMIEAGGGGSKTLTHYDAEVQGAYIKVSRIDRRKDLVAIIRPPDLPW